MRFWGSVGVVSVGCGSILFPEQFTSAVRRGIIEPSPFPRRVARCRDKGWVSKEKTPSSRRRPERSATTSSLPRVTAKRKSRNRSSSLSLASPASTPSVRALKNALNPTGHSGTLDQLGNTWQVSGRSANLNEEEKQKFGWAANLVAEGSPA
jgi:hypothetical protein